MSVSLLDQSSVVIVDAEPDDYFHLKPLIEKQDANPLFFQRGDELLHHGIPTSAVCWLINYELPDMSGLELAEVIRQRSASSTAFIVVDEYDAEAEMDVLVSGLAQFACKPIHASWLRDGVLWKPAYHRSKALRRRANVQVVPAAYPSYRRTVA